MRENECNICGGTFIKDHISECPACRHRVIPRFNCGKCNKLIKCAMNEGWSNCIKCNKQLCNKCESCHCSECDKK